MMKHRNLVCLVLIIVIVVSALSMAFSFINADTTPVLSVVQSGTNNVSTLPLIAVGSTFNVNIRVDNTESISQGISAYSYGLVWDPAVLNLTKVNDPQFLFARGQRTQYGSITHIVTGPGNNSGKSLLTT